MSHQATIAIMEIKLAEMLEHAETIRRGIARKMDEVEKANVSLRDCHDVIEGVRKAIEVLKS